MHEKKAPAAHSTKQTYYWIALNGASCAMSSVPWPRSVAVRPVPEQLLGFPTLKEARETQEFCLIAPITEVAERLESFRSRVMAGEIIVINPVNPESPTKDPTMWSSDGSIFKRQEKDSEAAAEIADSNTLIDGQARVSAITNVNGGNDE